jgi:hypothetical protein
MQKIGDPCAAPKCTGTVTGFGAENYFHEDVPGILSRAYCSKGHRVETWIPQPNPIAALGKPGELQVTTNG